MILYLLCLDLQKIRSNQELLLKTIKELEKNFSKKNLPWNLISRIGTAYWRCNLKQKACENWLISYNIKNYKTDCINLIIYYDEINSKIVYRCIEIDKLSDYKIFGYGFPKDFDISYKKIRPSAKNIGLLSMEKKNSYKENSIDNINPIYLTVEK